MRAYVDAEMRGGKVLNNYVAGNHRLCDLPKCTKPGQLRMACNNVVHLVDVMYLDFQNAFGKIPYRRLLQKLRVHGITGTIRNVSQCPT